MPSVVSQTDATKSSAAAQPAKLQPGDIVDVVNSGIGGILLIEGRATIVSRIRGEQDRYNVRFHSDGHRLTYPRFVLPENKVARETRGRK